MNRVIIIVMDSVGMGELPDAAKYGDVGSNTIGNISKATGGIKLPNLISLGLGNIDGISGISKIDRPMGCYGSMKEKSAGKDTTTGHWEIAGTIVHKPFPVYPHGFGNDIIKAFEDATGTKVLGNIPASGTEIIKDLGKKHMETGNTIVYTSADSVFQIAAHEDIIPIDRLYEMCKIARNILIGDNAVARVIARPFTGEVGDFKRTDRRHDFSVDPFKKTALDYVRESGLDVKAVGKIQDIFNGKGITHAVHTHNNMDGVDKTLEYMKEDFGGIIFTNLVDFDMHYGHRNDVNGYKKALEDFDGRIPEILSALKENDLIFITADHGCDPTFPGTDHTREYVPLLVYGKNKKCGINLGTRECFSDIAATAMEYLKINADLDGLSFINEITK